MKRRYQFVARALGCHHPSVRLLVDGYTELLGANGRARPSAVHSCHQIRYWERLECFCEASNLTKKAFENKKPDSSSFPGRALQNKDLNLHPGPERSTKNHLLFGAILWHHERFCLYANLGCCYRDGSSHLVLDCDESAKSTSRSVLGCCMGASHAGSDCTLLVKCKSTSLCTSSDRPMPKTRLVAKSRLRVINMS